MTLTPKEFQRRVNHNSAVVREAKARGHKANWLFDKIYTWSTTPDCDTHIIELMRKIDDIYPSLVLGQLAILDTNGADGYRLEDDETFTHVEYKHCLLDMDMISVGPKGGLRYEHGGSSNPTGITSAISAAYQIYTHETLQTKARDTYFLLSHKKVTEWELIEVRLLASHHILPVLERRTGKNRSISLAEFLNNGDQAVIQPEFEMQTWSKFRDQVVESACNSL